MIALLAVVVLALALLAWRIIDATEPVGDTRNAIASDARRALRDTRRLLR